jgi:hypothetical protein
MFSESSSTAHYRMIILKHIIPILKLREQKDDPKGE